MTTQKEFEADYKWQRKSKKYKDSYFRILKGLYGNQKVHDQIGTTRTDCSRHLDEDKED